MLFCFVLILFQKKLFQEHSGPDSLVVRASASEAGGWRFKSQCLRQWGSFRYGRLVSHQLVKRTVTHSKPAQLVGKVPGKRMGLGKQRCCISQKWLALTIVKLWLFSYPSVLTYVLGARKNHWIETVLLSTHNLCFGWEIRNFFFGIHT